ncbi:MAG: hypothetical protein AVDCRST_MAG73-2506, partial [uncultured Thermomicrobiales bacterium]
GGLKVPVPALVARHGWAPGQPAAAARAAARLPDRRRVPPRLARRGRKL